MKKILAFTGSSNLDSINEKLIQAIIRNFPDRGIEFIDLKAYNAPIFSRDKERVGIPEPIKALFHLFTEADAFIIASPEYNGLLSGLLKNTIDWLSRIDQKFFGSKPVLLLSTSPGSAGGSTHLQILEKLLPRWGGILAGRYSLNNFDQNYDESSQSITDRGQWVELENAMAALIQEPMRSRKSDIEVLEHYFGSFKNGDMEAVLNSFHDECYIVSVKEEERPKEQLHGIYRTKEEARQFLSNIGALFNPKDFSIERIRAIGEGEVMANGTFSHEVKATGKLFNSNWVQLCVIKDEKIKEYRFYEDSAAFITASAV